MSASKSLNVSFVARLGGPLGKIEVVRSYCVGVRDSEEARPTHSLVFIPLVRRSRLSKQLAFTELASANVLV